MNALARGAIELRDLVERFSSLSESALRACASADAAALAGALDARDLVTARVAALAVRLAALRLALPPEQRTSADALLLPVQRAGQHAAALNAQLLERAGALRLDIGKQIDQLRRDTEASSAYQAAGGRRASGAFDVAR
ncbi:MAG: hypothetical protein ACT4P7_00875 [Gemmatimonadaceae bacterium]